MKQNKILRQVRRLLIACILIFPLAFIAGHFRGITIGWQLIDCSFGAFGFLLLWQCYIKIKKLGSYKEHYQPASFNTSNLLFANYTDK